MQIWVKFVHAEKLARSAFNKYRITQKKKKKFHKVE